jgi:hypothetical protein
LDVFFLSHFRQLELLNLSASGHGKLTDNFIMPWPFFLRQVPFDVLGYAIQ